MKKKYLIVAGAVLGSAVLYYLYQNKANSVAIPQKKINYLDLFELREWFDENNQSYPNANKVVTLLDDDMIKKMNLSKELQGKKCLMEAFVDENSNEPIETVIIIYKEMSQSVQKYFTDTNTLILK